MSALNSQYARTIIMEPTRELQLTATKATTENLTFFFWKTTRCNKDYLKTLFSFSLTSLHSRNYFLSTYFTFDIFNKTVVFFFIFFSFPFFFQIFLYTVVRAFPLRLISSNASVLDFTLSEIVLCNFATFKNIDPATDISLYFPNAFSNIHR